MSLFNLSMALSTLSTASVTVRRPSAATYASDGTANAPTFTVFNNVRTSFQNLRQDELKHLPEGNHTTGWQKVWPQMVIQTGDRIVHPTKGTFIVQLLADGMADGGFTAAFARRLGDGES